MKRKLFLTAALAILLTGGNALTFGKDLNLHQTQTNMTKKQTSADKKEAAEKREADKKAAAETRKQAKSAAVASNTTKKKHKKFLGIF